MQIEPLKVAISVISYNQEKFISECIFSILNQSYHNLIIKVYDDGSTDKTVTILNKIKDPRLEVIGSTKNLGITKNSNRGIFFC